MAKKSQEEVTGEAVEAKANAVVTYWSPEHERLVVAHDPKLGLIQFEGHVLAVGSKRDDLIKLIESNSGLGKLFYRVENASGDEAYKERFQEWITKQLEDDELDQVKTERALIALTALFSDQELIELDVSRSFPNKTRLVRNAVEKKIVKGI